MPLRAAKAIGRSTTRFIFVVAVIIAAVVAACNNYCLRCCLLPVLVAVAQSTNFRAQNVSKMKRAKEPPKILPVDFFTWELVELQTTGCR